jgi:hypothetical protein
LIDFFAMDANWKSLEFYASVLHEIPDEAVESHLFSFDSSLGPGGDDLRAGAAQLLRTAAARCTGPRAERLSRAADAVVRGEPCARNEQGLSWREATEVNTCTLEEWEKLGPQWPSDKPPEIPHLDFWNLFPGLVVRIARDFEDYSWNSLHAGDFLHFRELDYFAKEGGFTLTFVEKELRLGELIPTNQPVIENEGNAYFEPYPSIESLYACYLSIRHAWAQLDLRRRWQTPILLGEIDACGRWLTQEGKRGDPPVCTNSALAVLLFPLDGNEDSERLPFQITFLFAGIVRCTNPEASLPQLQDTIRDSIFER